VSEPSFEEARAAVRERLSRESGEHCERVAETSAEIANAYGEDVDVARLAGLLHDWDRDTSADELLDRAVASGVEVTQEDRLVPYLLHARVGAAELSERYPGLDARVLEAVATHTLGAPVMSPLAKIVYVADMLEPVRSYPGVEELREAIGSCALDELFRRAYTRSLMRVLERRRHIHEATVETWNQQVAGERT
jgi:predicted HD superfamily hydrolase involved in NAD metabolism